MGKTRDLFKKIRDNKGTFHAKMGTMEQYSAIKWNKTESFVETWRDIESIIQSEVNQKNKYLLLMHIYGIRNMAKMSLSAGQEQRYRGREWTCAQEAGRWGQGNWNTGVDIYTLCSVVQSCLIFCDPTDCSLPGSSVHAICQARILAWVAISYSRVGQDQTFQLR